MPLVVGTKEFSDEDLQDIIDAAKRCIDYESHPNLCANCRDTMNLGDDK